MSPAPTPDMTQMRTTTAATKPAGPRARRGISGVPRMESHSRNRARSRPAHPSEPRTQERESHGGPDDATGSAAKPDSGNVEPCKGEVSGIGIEHDGFSSG